jgi:hypothetical protein
MNTINHLLFYGYILPSLIMIALRTLVLTASDSPLRDADYEAKHNETRVQAIWWLLVDCLVPIFNLYLLMRLFSIVSQGIVRMIQDVYTATREQ